MSIVRLIRWTPERTTDSRSRLRTGKPFRPEESSGSRTCIRRIRPDHSIIRTNPSCRPSLRSPSSRYLEGLEIGQLSRLRDQGCGVRKFLVFLIINFNKIFDTIKDLDNIKDEQSQEVAFLETDIQPVST